MFRRDLWRMVHTALGIEKPQTDAIVDHLMSSEVGVECIDHLVDVDRSMLPSTLSAIQKNRLLRYFSKHSSNGGEGTSSTAGPAHMPSSSGTQNPLDATSSRVLSGSHRVNIREADNFEFTVPWSSLPQKLVERLDKNEESQILATQKDRDELKLAIAKKLVGQYVDYKDTHPGKKKHPGIIVYDSVKNQVKLRYRHTLASIVNGQDIKDDMETFKKLFIICVENLMRDKNASTSGRSHTIRGKGLVGVLPEAYEPIMTKASEERQKGIREHLQNLYLSSLDSFPLDQIKNDLTQSFDLQRKDILEAKEKVDEQADENADEPSQEKALSELKRQWPYLFTVAGLKCHHLTLTGRDLRPHLDLFIENHLEFILMYLTTNSQANTANIVLRLRTERSVNDLTAQVKFLLVLNMLANHFKENSTNLLHLVEKTTLAAEVDTTGLQQLCIVSFDENPYEAKKFIICADELVLMEMGDIFEAVTALFEMAYVLDLEYSDLPFTTEFLERYVFGMGIPDTRIKSKNKKGKTIVVLTNECQKLISGLEKFEDDLKQMCS